MKKLLVLLLVLFIGSSLNAQDIKEKKIFDGLNGQSYSLYDFRYDVKTGSYVYSPYDTVTLKSKIISNKGNSDSYSGVYSYDVIFDNSGNYYAIATSNVSDLVNQFFFLKNGKVLKQFNNISFPLSFRDDGVYFMANDGVKDFRVKYNVNSGEFEYGKQYDTIYLSAMRPMGGEGEGEPSYVLGVTRDGRDYYIACKDQKQMLVIGNTEMKAYDEIYNRNTYEDSLGNIYYIAKEIANGKNSYFLVSGDKEYKKFSFVYPPVEFDKDNNPVYSASNEEEEYPLSSFVVKGNDVISRTFNRGIYEIKFTPSGKIAYVGADTIADGSYTNSLFVDGKEILTNASIMGVMFNNNEVPVYSSMDKDNNTYLMEGTKVISDKYSYIYDVKFSKSNKISYLGTIYGDYEKNLPNKSYYVYGTKKYGPYEEMGNYEGRMTNSIINDKGEFAFVATKSVKVKGEEYPLFKSFLVCDDWKSAEFSYISNLSSYKNDFYYVAAFTDSKGNENTFLYKNDDKLTEDYDIISELNIDTVKGIITFLGQKKNKAYYVEIKL